MGCIVTARSLYKSQKVFFFGMKGVLGRNRQGFLMSLWAAVSLRLLWATPQTSLCDPESQSEAYDFQQS